MNKIRKDNIMETIEKLKTKEEVASWLEENLQEKVSYKINEDLSVESEDILNFSHRQLKNIPIFIKKAKILFVDANCLHEINFLTDDFNSKFSCFLNSLSNLKGLPDSFNSELSCSRNRFDRSGMRRLSWNKLLFRNWRAARF